MVRGDQYTDESDSDWDSLSQAVPAPPMAQSAQLGGDDGHKTGPADEAVAARRPSSDSNRSMGAGKGPLTFIDRRLDSPAIQSTRDDSSPVAITSQKESSQSEVFDEDLPAPMAPRVELEAVQLSHKQQQQQPYPIPAGRIRSPSRPRWKEPVRSLSSDGFDNFAFEGIKSASPSRQQKPLTDDGNLSGIQLPLPDETIEIFSYDRINTEFSQVSEKRRPAMADGVSQTAFEVASRFCSEILVVIGVPFVIALAILLQLLRFVTAGLLRPLLIGLVMGLSDGIVKPALSALHNGVIAPLATFLHNVGMAVKKALEPLATILLLMTEPISRVLQSCRLADIHHHHHHKPIRQV